MKAEEQNAAPRPDEGVFFDLSARAKLWITGADRLRYLNGQITNDLRRASETRAIHGCVLSAKGKIDAEVFIAAESEGYLVDSDPGMEEALSARLERYIIADEVQLEVVTEKFALFHLLRGANDVVLPEGKRREATRFGEAGLDLWVPRGEGEGVRAQLAASFSFCDDDCAETLRIERGLPRWGRELTDAIIPTEANLEASAIDYAKGCYIGQEVISRIKMSGQTNKRLCGFVSANETPLREGMRLWTSGAEAKEVGWITSVTTSARLGKQIALGIVKRGFQEAGTVLLARAGESGAAEAAMVKIVALPFV